MTHRAHLGFLVDLARPLHHQDDDLVGGRFLDANGDFVGEVLLEGRNPPRRFLLVVEDDMPAMHVEAVLENDHRVAGAARCAVLRYGESATVPAGVSRDGDLWDSGAYKAFAFGSEEEARTAEAAPVP
ncbi:MAG: hypothetical protein ABI782_08615 [Anaerolineaceae bacterium]